MAAGSIVVDLIMKTGSFETDTKRAQASMKKLEKQVKDTAKVVGAAFVAAATGVAYFVKTQIDAADELGKMAAKAGVSTEALSELGYAAELSGSSQQELTDSLVKLSRQMQEAASGSKTAQDAFANIGVSVTDASGRMKSADEVFKEIAARFASMPDGVEKTAAAVEIFGRSGANLIPTLNSGSAGLKQMADEAGRLGLVISGDTAMAAAEFNDNLTRLQKTVTGIGIGIANDLLPWLVRMTDELVIGMKHTNGLIDAIFTLGTINPFRTQADNLKKYREELSDLQKARDRYLASNADTRAIDDAIANLQKKINYLAEIQNRAALANVQFSPDDQSAAESRRLGLTPPARTTAVTAPSRLPAVGRSSRNVEQEQALRAAMQAEKEYSDWMQSMREAELDRYVEMLDRREAEEAASKERLIAQGQLFFEATRTPIERLNIELAEQQRLLDALGPAYQDTYFRAVEAAQAAYDSTKQINTEMDDFAKRAAENIQDSLGDGLYDLMQGNFKGIGDSFKKMLDRMVAEALAAKLARALFGESAGGEGEGIFGSVLKSIGGAFFGGAKAGGGDVMAGRSYLVGEQGPEMFVPRTAGAIIPNSQTVNNTKSSQVIQVNVQANPQMSRDSALQQGRVIGQGIQLALNRNG